MMRSFARLSLVGFVVAAALAGVGGSAPAAHAEGPGTWTLAADVPANQATTTSVLLRNGSVLLAGGWLQYFDPGNAVRSHKYNPTTNTWTQTGLQITPRRDATVAQLPIGNVLMAGGTTGGADGLASTEFYRPFTNDWIAGPPMTDARRGQVAVALLDDRVLHIGGSDDGTCLSSVESYDPVANAFSMADSLATARSDFDGVLLQDGRVLIAGGGTCGGAVTATAEIFDPGTGQWSAADDMLSARRYHKMTLLPDGRVLAVGGSVEASEPYPPLVDAVGAEVYDPDTDTWTATGAMVDERAYHDIVLLGNGKVLAAGGWPDGNGITATQLTSTETYDPATNTWTAQGDLQHGRADYMNLAMLYDGRVLATGGEASLLYLNPTAELYDPTSWQPAAPMSEPRTDGALTLLQDGRVSAFGGLDAGDPSSSSETYDAATDAWTASGTMVWPNDSQSPTLLPNGRVLLSGGFFTPNGMEVWNPATDTFSLTPDLGHDHEGSTATLLKDGRVFVFGGPVSAVPEIYNPATNSSVQVAAAPTPRRYHRAILLSDGRVLILGGFDFTTSIEARDPWIYDPGTNSWSTAAGGHTGGMTAVGAALLANGDVLAAGGENALTSPDIDPTDAVSIFDPDTNGWSAGTTMPAAGYGDAVLLYDNTVLFAQGNANFTYRPGTATWADAGVADVQNEFVFMTARLPSGKVLVAGGVDPVGGEIGQVNLYDLGIHTDTDGDGYHDGVELALGQHPWSFCATMRADVNMDGNINSGDQLKMAQNYFSKPPQERVDQDGNLKINAGDQLKLALQISKSVLMCP